MSYKIHSTERINPMPSGGRFTDDSTSSMVAKLAFGTLVAPTLAIMTTKLQHIRTN